LRSTRDGSSSSPVLRDKLRSARRHVALNVNDLDTIRSCLFEEAGKFVDKLGSAGRADPELQAEVWPRLNSLFKYASVRGFDESGRR